MRKGTDRKRKLGSFPFLSVVFTITLSLIVLGLFGLLTILTGNLTKSIQENVEIQVYLNKPISETEVSRIQRIVSSKMYILKGQGSPSVQRIRIQERILVIFWEIIL
ncbi:MAG: hypothetical protein ACO2ZZ_04825 [Cyclobacteriaceae bacterium]